MMAVQPWMTAGLVGLVLLLTAIAGLVALLHQEDKCAERGYRVLRLLLGISVGGAVTALVKLHASGLL